MAIINFNSISGVSTISVASSITVGSGVTITATSITAPSFVGNLNSTSGATTVAAGSTSAPSITPTGDSNTGIFFPSADTIAFAEGGVEAARFDSSGQLGIGTASVNFSQFGSNTGGVAIADIGVTNTGLKISDGIYHNYLVQAGNSNLYLSHYGSSGDIIFGAGSSGEERSRITSTGDVQIANGNLVFSTTGRGIDFSATSQAAGMTSELLADYEEGTWTPGLTFGGVSTGITYSVREGTYVKIGKFVTCYGLLVLTNNGTGTGGAELTGLPFGVGNNLPSTAIEGGGLFTFHSNTGGTIYGTMTIAPLESSTVAAIYKAGTTAGVMSGADDTNITNSFDSRFTFTYIS